MDLSIIFLIAAAGVLIISLLHSFFGYKLGRILLPIGGLIVIEGLNYLFIYKLFVLDTLGTWLFFGGSAIAFYVILFVLKRVAGFFTGLLGTGLFLIYVVYALNLNEVPYLYPIFFTLCIIAGLLAVVYKQIGVILLSSLFGGCITSFVGLYLLLVGNGGQEFVGQPNLLVPIVVFLQTNSLLIIGAALVISAAGALVQIFATGDRQLITKDDEFEEKPHKEKAPKKKVTKSVSDSWIG